MPFSIFIDDGGLPRYSEKVFNIYSHELKMFFQIIASKGDTGQFFGEIAAYKQYSFRQQTFSVIILF